MKYVKTFESHRSEKLEPINEELFGGIINFFKNMWNKATEELKKLGENPSVKQVDDWVDKNPFNPTDDNYIFKNVVDEFRKKPEANDQDCLTLVDNILDPETGVLGKQGLQPLYDNVLKAFGKNTSTLPIIQFFMETVRDRAIKDYKYAGGPDIKPGQPIKIDPAKKNMNLTDMTHLPDVKKLLTSAPDNKKKKEVTINWVEKNLIPRLEKYLDEVTNEQVEAFLKSKGVEAPTGADTGELKPGDSIVYKREKFLEDEWKKLTEDDKAKPNEGKMKELQDKEMIGIKKVKLVTGDEISFEDADFKKTKSDVLMTLEVDQNDEAKKAAESLGKIKADPEKMKKVASFADFLQDDANKDKVAEIEKIISGGEAAA